MGRVDRDEHLALFGEQVRHHRLALGWSQERLAEESGLHRTYVGSLERGERNVSLKNIYVLAKALGVEASNLLSPSQQA